NRHSKKKTNETTGEKEEESDDEEQGKSDEKQLEQFLNQLNDLFNNGTINNKFKQLLTDSYRVRKQFISNQNISFRDILEKMTFTKTIDFIKVEFEIRTKEAITKITMNLTLLIEKLKRMYPSIDSSEVNMMPEDSSKTFDAVYCSHLHYSYYPVYSNIIKFDLTSLPKPTMLAIYLVCFYSFDLTWLTKQEAVSDITDNYGFNGQSKYKSSYGGIAKQLILDIDNHDEES
ncbi:unnamed protein product, partial [Didymodactylos carnosus]